MNIICSHCKKNITKDEVDDCCCYLIEGKKTYIHLNCVFNSNVIPPGIYYLK